VIPPAGRNIVTMSVKPSDFWGRSRNRSRNIFGGSRNIQDWDDGVLLEKWSSTSDLPVSLVFVDSFVDSRATPSLIRMDEVIRRQLQSLKLSSHASDFRLGFLRTEAYLLDGAA
jgi:hypothetical protein